MPKYLFQASYTVSGEEGIRSKGGTDRRDAVADTVHSVGGELECMYFEFGDRGRLFDRRSSRRRGRRGRRPDCQRLRRSDGENDVLLTPEQVDEAANRVVTYRPPGL